jgi:hypothetical protein
MRGSLLAVLALLSSVSLACSKARPPRGKPVSLAAVCDEPDGSRVRLRGYLRYVRGLTDPCSTNAGRRRCALELHESSQRPPDPDDAPSPPFVSSKAVKLSFGVGEGPAEMYNLPSNFTGIGVVVHLESGANALDGSNVTVDGVVTKQAPASPSFEGAKSCLVTVDWIEAGAGN